MSCQGETKAWGSVRFGWGRTARKRSFRLTFLCLTFRAPGKDSLFGRVVAGHPNVAISDPNLINRQRASGIGNDRVTADHFRNELREHPRATRGTV